jgi:hypothetical protein
MHKVITDFLLCLCVGFAVQECKGQNIQNHVCITSVVIVSLFCMFAFYFVSSFYCVAYFLLV